VVTIIDPGGEVADYSAKSSNIGFFSYKLSEEFKESHLIVQLVGMEGNCEPLPLGRYDFEKSYDDYKKGKQEEEGAYKLVLNISGRYEMKELSFIVKNALNEAVEGVEVKITKPDNSVLTIQTDSTGLFKWTPDIVGIWKLQAGKDDYESSKLNSIEIFQNKQYFIDIKTNGESKPAPYKKGDRLTFELKEIENNTIIPLTLDATFAGQTLKFISGISDSVTFNGTSTLVIPTTEGYIGQTLELIEKQTSWGSIFVWIGIIIGVLVVVILVVVIVKKIRKGSSSGGKSGKMEIQLGGPEEE